MTDDDARRLEALARRVRWLDFWRKPIGVVVGLVVFVVVLRATQGRFEPAYVVSATFSVFGGLAAWWVAEVVMAWFAAVWETRHDALAQGEGLPVAQLLTRRRGSRRDDDRRG